ncbi:MFS transporter [Frateuria defendens]|uniref:MFS transporter n=1 Tax=Frateuria defendens TaxID=2219559 RepID=UPI00066FDCCE|nr:MFS transporter [Frateuria defendens]
MPALGPLARRLHIPEAWQVSSPRPWVGLLAVMLAALASTLTNRLTGFGLADIGGVLGASVDERAWITTAFSCAQMLVGPLAAWAGFVLGARRVLLAGTVVFGLSELLLPWSPNLPVFLALQCAAGLGSGTFIPLTIGFVLRSLPKPLWAFGIAAYAMNLELSLNIAATLEGWYIDHAGWAWIFWQNALLAIAILACVVFGVPKEPIKYAEHGHGDYWGMAFAGLGFTLIYAALDQGNRLDWLNSGLIVGLFVAGGGLLLAFAVHEYTCQRPDIEFGFLLQRNVMELLGILVIARLLVLGSNFLVPQFLIAVTGFRPQQIGSVLLWIALPQVIIGPCVGLLLKRWDARYLLGAGMVLILFANLAAARVDATWTEPDFIAPLLVQAVGQTMLLTSLVYFLVQHLRPMQVLTFGAIVQTVRLFGGEVASAILQTYTRKASQLHSNLIGQHVASGDGTTAARLAGYTRELLEGHGLVGPANGARSLALLDGAVERQAQTLAYADGFLLTAGAAAVALVIIAMLRPAPSG